MTDKFLQKILDATAQVRDQGERQLSEKGKALFALLVPPSSWAKTLKAFKIVMGEDWYKSHQPPYTPMKNAVILNDEKLLLLTKVAGHTIHFMDKNGHGGTWPDLRIERPATVEEIHEWYSEFLK